LQQQQKKQQKKKKKRKRMSGVQARRWIVTGAAGFIGSHLLERLLRDGAEVTGFDDFSTGDRNNLRAVEHSVGPERFSRLRMIEGDIRDHAAVSRLFDGAGVDTVVLHQAALGSVPRSISEPMLSFSVNVDGFANVLEAARKTGVQRFVYASSSSVYGDNTDEKKREERCGRVLSPYAATKAMNESWATSYSMAYGMEAVGLRYFNVFGSRQSPDGPYAAVIPRWCRVLVTGGDAVVYGDGSTSRDFCFVDNVVSANILAGLSPLPSKALVCNIACGDSTSLLALWEKLRRAFVDAGVATAARARLRHEPFRLGDIRHSCAEINVARSSLGYAPTVGVDAGLAQCARSYPKG
jgi:UDP-N-acetylglucosamine/UDP-N-acetylgalactosamine 4-epimerase